MNQLARRNGLWILENAAGTRSGRLGFPTFGAKLVHPLGDGLRGGRLALEHGAQSDVVLEQRAAAILDIDLAGLPLVDVPRVIHEPNGIDRLEHPRAHRAGVHAERAADAAGDAIQKLQSGQTTPAGLDRGQLRFGPRPPMQLLPMHPDLREARAAPTDHKPPDTALLYPPIRN